MIGVGPSAPSTSSGLKGFTILSSWSSSAPGFRPIRPPKPLEFRCAPYFCRPQIPRTAVVTGDAPILYEAGWAWVGEGILKDRRHSTGPVSGLQHGSRRLS